ncbi:hypothetical protein HN011_010735 [Eciton burchellii]|nr:hypothetical protein HN011_010735 [Eciton burchellii]
MACKAIIFIAFLAVAFAERPYLGFRIRFPISPQIVGGSDAPEGAYPYIVSLQWGFSSTSHFCAASIYNRYWLITAAHCIQAVPNIGRFIIKAGKHKLSGTEKGEQEREVESSIVHEKYQGGVAPYDIGMIKLKTPLDLTSKQVQSIGLPEAESEPTGDAILCGWGSTSSSHFPDMPDRLQHVKLVHVNRVTCHESVERLTGYSPVHETNVCTGPLSGGTSACSGDSGGPLIKRSGDKVTLTGIVSWGIIPCGTIGAPSVYTRVSKFNGWIQNVTATY